MNSMDGETARDSDGDKQADQGKWEDQVARVARAARVGQGGVGPLQQGSDRESLLW